MARVQKTDPQTIGPYRVLRLLGAGGMGRVYLGIDTDGAQAAVKVVNSDLLRDEQFRKRFTREAAATAAVSGRFIAGIVASDLDGEEPWLATEYIDGPALSTVISDEGPLAPARAQEIAAGLAEALSTIHDAGVVHRDVKPANVLLARHGPHLIDFGIARDAAASTITRTGIVVGTPPYMSPEQIRGRRKIGPPADVFAVGGVLTFAITGRHPFGEGDPTSLAYRIAHEEPDLDGIDDHLIKTLITACLAKSPGDRPTAPELQEKLGSVTTRPVMSVVPGKAVTATSTRPTTAAEVETGQEALTEVPVALERVTPGEVGEASDPAPDVIGEVPGAEAAQPGNGRPAGAAAGDQTPAEPVAVELTAGGLPPGGGGTPPAPTDVINPNRRRRMAAALTALLIVVAGAGALGTVLMQGGGKKNSLQATEPPTGRSGSFPTDPSSDSSSSPASPSGTTSSSVNPPPSPHSTAVLPPAPTTPSATTPERGGQAPNTVIVSGPGGTITTTVGGHSTTLPAPHTTTSKPVKPPTSNPSPPHGDAPSAPTASTPTVAPNSAFNGYIVTFTWSAVPGATSYDVHYTFSTVPGEANSIDQIIPVPAGTSYQRSDYGPPYPANACFSVRAVNAYGASAWAPASPVCV